MKIKRWFLINIDKETGDACDIIATFDKELSPEQIKDYEEPSVMFYWKIVEVEYDVDTMQCY